LLLLAVSAMMVLVAGSAVLAQPYYSDGSASASATASASASATAAASASASPMASASALPKSGGGALRKTGGPPLAVPIVMVGLMLVGSGVAAHSLVRRYISG
jgi:hypothetical protein